MNVDAYSQARVPAALSRQGSGRLSTVSGRDLAVDLAYVFATSHFRGAVVCTGDGAVRRVRRGVAANSGLCAGGVRAGDLARGVSRAAVVSPSRVVAGATRAAGER